MIVSERNETVPEAPEVLLSRLEKEANTRNYSGFMKHFVTLYLLCFTLFQLYTAIVGTVPPQIVRMVHLGFAIPLSYLLYPATSKGSMDQLHPLDLLLAIAFLLAAGYYLYNYDALIERIGFYTTLDIFVGAMGMILVMEACRRVVGWPIVIIAVVFILYASYGIHAGIPQPPRLFNKANRLATVFQHRRDYRQPVGRVRFVCISLYPVRRLP